VQKRDIRNFVLPRRTTDPLARETMTGKSSRADRAQVQTHIHAMRAIGPYKTGVPKPTFSEPHLRSLARLVQRIPEAGLAGEIDGIGPADGPSIQVALRYRTHPDAKWNATYRPKPLGLPERHDDECRIG
jgi:beta-ureidopropionase / N-carbamoyl-L-amino-acid hydrolase